MPAVKAARPNEIFAPDEWRTLTRVSPVRGLWLALHGWLVVALAAGGTALAWDWHWLAGLIATPFAIAIIGGRQLGLSILMHEAAHGLLHPNRKINNFAGQWLTGAATGSDLHSYRAYHLTHHKFTQQPEDPDLGLSKPFPTTRASMRRKIIRDLTGQTFFKQRSNQFGVAWKGLRAMLAGSTDTEIAAKRDTSAGTPFNRNGAAGVAAPVTDLDGAKKTTRTVARFLVIQLLVLAISLATLGIIPFLIWLAALATTFQLFLRIRNIAEHACTSTGSGDPFSHARTTYANFWERTTMAPYWVNYHSEHHLFMGVPCYNLAKAHNALMVGGFEERMTIASGYREILKTVTAKAATAS
ncbi:fatty acid desaturase family protein [Parasphingorhabdus halotolerans]|uniref:Fatty acid desaturase n=1 Tax=Parasphingorhabdus halotolerans TaxID=2725558 RepID=A0A6H2DMY7_9SPHN|nr:fatty acid desaturase [Parasphingorhabdus halotolerans]QJB70032.1 fatty acid desaturase [Parasphingorhabdus halotolerans]